MNKFKTFFNLEKEEKWLESMARQGWLLTKLSLFYHFERITPQDAVIRIDYRNFKSKQEYLEYCTLFEDSGWRKIAGGRYSGSQYFLKVREDGTEDIFSDKLSQAGRYKRISDMWFSIALIFFVYQIVMLIGGWNQAGTAFSVKEWYFTEGLWEMKGFSFWFAFLFETPFALLRGFGFPLIAALIYVGFAIKTRLLYRSVLGKNADKRE